MLFNFIGISHFKSPKVVEERIKEKGEKREAKKEKKEWKVKHTKSGVLFIEPEDLRDSEEIQRQIAELKSSKFYEKLKKEIDENRQKVKKDDSKNKLEPSSI